MVKSVSYIISYIWMFKIDKIDKSPAQPYSPPGREEEEEVVVLLLVTPSWLRRPERTDCILPISLFRETCTKGRRTNRGKEGR